MLSSLRRGPSDVERQAGIEFWTAWYGQQFDEPFRWFLLGRILTALGGGAMVPVALAVVGDVGETALRRNSLCAVDSYERWRRRGAGAPPPLPARLVAPNRGSTG